MPAVRGGGLSTSIPRRFALLAEAAARASGVPIKVVAAQIDIESGWDPRALSPTGAEGIAQFEPGTWASYGHGSPFNPADAFPAYAKFMGSLLRQFRGNLRNALAAYNAGPGNIAAGYGYADTILAAAGLPQNAHGGQSMQIPYRNPLRGIRGLTAERVDMGVDYSGTGPIYALGPGVITEADTSWAGGLGTGPGTFIAERLTSGPLKGRYVYASEHIIPRVRVGQRVTAATPLGDVVGGIETGFAVGPSSPGTTSAMAAGQTPAGGDPGARPTAFGEAYSKILAATGAPGGTLAGQAVGQLPSWLQRLVSGLTTGGKGIGGGGLLPSPLGGIGSAIQGISDWLNGLNTAIDWLLNPASWVRILAGVGGGVLVISGVVILSHAGGQVPVPGTSGSVSARPAALPVGILMVGGGGVLLFVAFHNLPGSPTNIGELLGSLRDEAQSASAGQPVVA